MKINELVKLDKVPKGIQKLIGTKINRLTVLGFVGKFNTAYYVEVRCECGVEKLVTIGNMVYGTTKSCGCLQQENRTKTRKTA